MTKTKTKFVKFCGHFVATFRQPVVTCRENAFAAQPTAVRTAYCVIASNLVFSNIISRHLNSPSILSKMASKTNIGRPKESSTWDDVNVTRAKSD